jgi:hypothetical protein
MFLVLLREVGISHERELLSTKNALLIPVGLSREDGTMATFNGILLYAAIATLFASVTNSSEESMQSGHTRRSSTLPSLSLTNSSDRQTFDVRRGTSIVVSLRGPMTSGSDYDQWSEVSVRTIDGSRTLVRLLASHRSDGAVVATFRAVSPGSATLSAQASPLNVPGRPFTNSSRLWSVTLHISGT